MNVDRGSFLMLVTTLAAGGAVGYVASEKRVIPAVDGWVGRSPEPGTEPSKPVAPPPAVSMSAPPPPPAPPPPAGPICDDMLTSGPVGECPGPGLPTVEGGCGSFASLRCNELKASLKPKVAAAAVDCIAKLKGQERCDPLRVQLCGHLALMNACPDTPPAAPPSGMAMTTDAAAPAHETWRETPVAMACHTMIESCGASSIAPSMSECRQLLSGMTAAGRDKTSACMKTHCFDRGLVGCEGIEPKK